MASRFSWFREKGPLSLSARTISAEVLAKGGAFCRLHGMTTVARLFTIDQALLMRSMLEGFGIKAYVPDEFAAQTDPVIFMGSMNSIRVQVDDGDAIAARAVLAENGLTAET